MSSSNAKILEYGRKFQKLQDDRIRQFNILNDAHKVYLSTAPDYNLSAFQESVSHATSQFKNISQDIISIRSDVMIDKTLANLIGKVQILEEKKLHMTVDHQLAIQQAQDEPDDDLMQENAKKILKQLAVLASDITDTMEEVRYHLSDLEEEQDNQSTPNN